MKSVLLKDTIRSIRKRAKIFLSIMIMSFLGVGFYSGLKITAPDMALTQKEYFDKTTMYDLQVYTKQESGFNEEDIKKLSEIEKLKKIEKDFSIDAEIKVGNKNQVVKVIKLNSNINKVVGEKGKISLSPGEVLIDSKLADKENIKIGSVITLKNQLFAKTDYKVIGIVNSPLYTSSERGSATIGTGRIDGFMYINRADINLDLTTSLYLKFDIDDSIFAKSYTKQVDEYNKEVKKVNKSYLVFSREDNESASMFNDDVKRIASIATIFPAIFFLVAALISLTSTTRMVEEERVQLGTLKALGYKNSKILKKYIAFAILACLIGGIAGFMIGVRVLPSMIYSMYKNIYNMGPIVLSHNLTYPVLGLFFLTGSVVAATIYSAMRELRNKPAMLMRPKAPKHGKRVFIERITPLWKKLSFTSKVTLRNLFRYKKRFVMTVAGVAGCMSLIIAGFGLRDSVSSVIDMQYNNIFTYDLMMVAKGKISTDDLVWKDKYKVSTIETATSRIELIKDTKKVEHVNLLILEKEYDKYIKLLESKKQFELEDNEIAITKKAASLLKVKAGDTIKIKNDKLERYVKVDRVVDNYIMHYVYMSHEKYESVFGQKIDNNALLIKYDEKLSERSLSKDILKGSNVSLLSSTSENKKSMDDVMNNLNYVAIILIVAAASLALAVLYTLSNVNISERMREVATIKVLGFKDSEVYNYIAKENKILIAIGMLFGIAGGYFVNAIILKTAEVDALILPTNITWYYYVISMLITIVFSLIVSIMNYFTLKKINMIESLKSVE